MVQGQASFSTVGRSLNITNSPGAIINWQGFSIGADETARFIQQGAASSVLNRVIGPDPSAILGTLTSNGRVFLINPSGILFGQGARVDVAGLVASTLNLSNQDFLAGRLNFEPNPLAGKVENQGSITTPSGGSVYLVGSTVINSGLITSPQGDVILAAGQSVKIFDSGTPGVRVELTASDNSAFNLGEILAQSGQVGIYGAALRNAGVVNADQVVRGPSGKIVLRAKQDVTLEAGSRLSASGEQAGEITVQSEAGTTLVSGTIEAMGTGDLAGKGGGVQLLGNRVGLIAASVDASGTAGGGTVLIGGNFNGAGPEQNAFATTIGAESSINADAINSGNGGRIAVWSDGDTSVAGVLTARGGANSGDGGFIETSGHNLSIADSARVNTLAPYGKPGTWLLDPKDFTIAASGGDMSGSLLGTFLGDGNVSILSSNGGVEGAGDIHVNDAVTWGAATTLTLSAERDVNVNEAITATDGSFVANAVRDVNVNAATKTTSGSLTSNAGNDVNMAAAMTVVTGDLTSNAGHDVNVTASMTVTTGNIVLRADNDGTGPGVAGGTVAFTGIGGLTITTGEASIRFNPADYSTTNAEITAYGSHLTGGGTLDAKAWVFAQGDNRIYDGTNAATLSFKGTPTAGGEITLNDPGSGATFSDKNAGVGKTVTYSGFTIGGAGVAIFSLFGDGSGTATATIAKLDTTVSGTRVYDQTVNAAGADLTTVSALIAGDVVTVSGTGTVADKNVAANKALTNGSLALADTDAGNYNLLAAGNTLSITKLDTTVSGTRVYDQTVNAAG
ncbi:MAG: filamentous hemagglutinin N-terminal domain-containing protein, partial [Phycisphaeraceae bacterium]